MLEYWYSERCSRQFKFFLCLLTVLAIFAASGYAKLDQSLSLIALLAGMCVHLLREFKQKFLKQNWANSPIAQRLPYLPILLMLLLITQLPSLHRLALSIQLLGFSGLGFYLVSIYNYRAPRDG